MERQALLFVCTGNICRSPMAQAYVLHRAGEDGLALEADSAAVSSEEIGRPPDGRAVAELSRHGVTMPMHRARQVTLADFGRFDLVIGMTRSHCASLRALAPGTHGDKVRLLLDAVPGQAGRDVPDPWYGPDNAFAEVYALIAAGVDAVVDALSPRKGPFASLIAR